MAEIGEMELQSAMEDDINFNSAKSELESVNTSIEETKGQMLSDQEYAAQLQQELEALQEQISEKKQNLADQASKFDASLETWRQSIAEKINIPLAEVDFSKDYNDWHPDLQEHVKTQIFDLLKTVQEMQAEVGESGKTLEDSPKTRNRLIKKTMEVIEDNGGDEKKKSSTFQKALIFIMFLSAIGIMTDVIITKKKIGDALSKAGQIGKFLPIGCIQYHFATGSIRTLGICGVQELCDSKNSKDDCNNVANGVCSWSSSKSGSGTCLVADKISQAPNCCPVCETNDDCTEKTDVICTHDSDCIDGKCISGKCLIKNNCNQETKTCSSCESLNPQASYIQKFLDGKLGFCTASIPSTKCGVATKVCSIYNPENNTGGMCKSCGSIEECTNPGGNLSTKSYCMCESTKDNVWMTIPICGDPSQLILLTSFMHSYIPNWQPIKTPKITIIIGIISLIIMFLTIIWYVRYLIKYGKP